MDVNISNDELYHYGRKGMKWYQNIYSAVKDAKTARTRRKNLEKAREAKKTKAEEAKKRQSLIDKGLISAKKMTPQELEAKIKRLELEKKYGELKRDSSQLNSSRGKKFIEKFLDSTVEKVADSAADVVAQTFKTFGVEAVNKKVFNGEEKTYTNNKKK